MDTLLPEKLSRLGPFHECLVSENSVLESCFGVLFAGRNLCIIESRPLGVFLKAIIGLLISTRMVNAENSCSLCEMKEN